MVDAHIKYDIQTSLANAIVAYRSSSSPLDQRLIYAKKLVRQGHRDALEAWIVRKAPEIVERLWNELDYDIRTKRFWNVKPN
ncbi:MAG TPA: hypothetical protein VIY48_14275 [Candidatus Paceibacterota bacterium]